MYYLLLDNRVYWVRRGGGDKFKLLITGRPHRHRSVYRKAELGANGKE